MLRSAGLLVPVSVLLLSSASCEHEPPPRPPETTWKQVASWSGHGNAQLETFPVERFTWRVRWETSNESPAGAGAFHLTANSGDSGRILADVVDTRGVGKDVAYITEIPHRYYLVVTSSGLDWSIVVEEPVLR
jgi:hypothetical protein